MSNEELMRRIRLGEDSALELKRIELQGRKVTGPSRKDFADELAAFANARGGTIVLGVDDKTRAVLGILLDDLDAVEDWVREICNDTIEPALDADILSAGTGWRRWTAAARYSSGYPAESVRAQKPKRLFSQARQFETRNAPGCACPTVSGTHPKPHDTVR